MDFYKLSRTVFFAGVFLLPLIFIPFLQNGFEGAKVVFFQVWILILGILSSFYILSRKSAVNNGLILVLVMTYFFWNLFTGILGVSPVDSFYGLYWRKEGLVTLGGYVIMVWVISGVLKRNDMRTFYKILIASGFSVCAYVGINILMQRFFGWPIQLYSNRMVGTLGNPNFLGGYLAIIFPLIFLIKNWPIRLFVSFGFLVTMLLSGSRGAFLGMGVVFVFFLWLKLIFQNKLVGWSIFVIFVFGFLLWFNSWLWTIPWKDPNFAASRQRLWARGIMALAKRPILGYGLENYSIAVKHISYPKIKFGFGGEVYADKAHNEILEILISSGIPGLVLWMGIFLYVARNYYIRRQYLFLAALLIFFVKAQTNVVSVSEYVLYWMLVGFSVGDV